MFKFIVSCVAFIALVGCSQKPAQVIFNDTLAGYTDRIIVEDSDNIYTIASKYDVSMQALVQANNIKFPFLLKEGQTLVLPYPDQYSVKKGDSIYDVAKQFNLNISQFIAMNALKSPYTLNEGQVLSLPPSIKSNNKGARALVYVKPVMKEQVVAENLPAIPIPRLKNQQQVQTKISQVQTLSRTLRQKKKDEGFIWPVKGRLISAFGPKAGGLYNDGINISVKEGESVKASASGTVVYADDKLEGYGNLVIIKHSNGYITAYAHNKELLVHKGDDVSQGDEIAISGRTGNVTVSQLHFGIRKGKKPVNPEQYLKRKRS